MHEYGIALEIADAVMRETESHSGGHVKSVTVEVGDLTMVNPEQLRFSWDLVIAETPLQDASLNVKKILGEGECECGFKGQVHEPFCPTCGSTVRITGGRDILLRKIDLEVPL